MNNDIMLNSNDPIVKALVTVGFSIGLISDINEEEIYIKGCYCDAYLAILTLAQRIAAGDIEIVEKGDSADYKEYFYRLLDSCKNLDIKSKREEVENG